MVNADILDEFENEIRLLKGLVSVKQGMLQQKKPLITTILTIFV
jgi:hypothetical protein